MMLYNFFEDNLGLSDRSCQIGVVRSELSGSGLSGPLGCRGGNRYVRGFNKGTDKVINEQKIILLSRN
jgi:hypothetical protein